MLLGAQGVKTGQAGMAGGVDIDHAGGLREGHEMIEPSADKPGRLICGGRGCQEQGEQAEEQPAYGLLLEKLVFHIIGYYVFSREAAARRMRRTMILQRYDFRTVRATPEGG